MTNELSITDNVLKQAQDTIDSALQSKALNKSDRAILEVQNYFLMFLRDDHKKVTEMYPYFISETREKEKRREEDKWFRRQVFGTAIAAFVMLLFNGFLFLVSTIPFVKALVESAK